MQPIYIVFGTESGNAQGLAERAAEALEKKGLSCKVVDMLDLAYESVADLDTMLVITSTYGNGDPPSNAEGLHAYLMKKAPMLPRLRFSVCGLGDTTYERFCQCGKDFDRRLEELGATRLHPRQDCDVDYEVPFEKWLAAVIPALQAAQQEAAAQPPPTTPPPEPQPIAKHVDVPGTRRNPVAARVLANLNLNGAGSTKETRHVALSLDGLPISYEVGDSIGIWPDNDPEKVAAVLRLTGLSGTETARVGDIEAPIAELLRNKLDIQEPDVRLVDRVLETANAEDRQAAARSHHVIDLLERRKLAWSAHDLVHHLRPLAPRLYSIASSPLAHPREVHLLIDVVRYELFGRPRMGITSELVVNRAAPGAAVSIYHHPTPSFRLRDPDDDVVMIGPGTGVAPFRAFLEERCERRGKGRSWLFFGARNQATDFFYRTDFERFSQGGVLTNLDVAFSRDQQDKVYVQHRLAERGAELAAWIANGATIYVCGDAKHMAPDVHAALRDILVTYGKQTPEGAVAELERMAGEGRYQRDVY
ncbi:MAG: sulfite reductase [NADPH] flavoprotein alpha-component [Polyangiaceae bacterium]|nr:sulfite reductase [NADPH] flavoprotein alpha-component [Polyangiaceae bacterium]